MGSSDALSMFEPVENRRAFEDILLQLEHAISNGRLAAGDRLPPERELAERFQVSRTSVREALRVLETLGVVSVRRGAENGAVLMRRPGNAFAPTLRLLLALEHVSLSNVVEFRVMIESSAARLLAKEPDEEVLGRLRDLLPETADQFEFHKIDAAFHRTLVEVADNDLVDLMVDATNGVMSKLINDVVLVSWDWKSSGARLLKEHREIYDAIAAGDADAAAERVTEHARYWGNRVIQSTITPGVSATVTHRGGR
jgi:GntR family transcriptional regulator, transcriptional repressor for pyruvate dehydrogenase complex